MRGRHRPDTREGADQFAGDGASQGDILIDLLSGLSAAV